MEAYLRVTKPLRDLWVPKENNSGSGKTARRASNVLLNWGVRVVRITDSRPLRLRNDKDPN